MRSFGIIEKTCGLVLDKDGGVSFIQRRDLCHDVPLFYRGCRYWRKDPASYCLPCKRYLFFGGVFFRVSTKFEKKSTFIFFLALSFFYLFFVCFQLLRLSYGFSWRSRSSGFLHFKSMEQSLWTLRNSWEQHPIFYEEGSVCHQKRSRRYA